MFSKKLNKCKILFSELRYIFQIKVSLIQDYCAQNKPTVKMISVHRLCTVRGKQSDEFIQFSVRLAHYNDPKKNELAQNDLLRILRRETQVFHRLFCCKFTLSCLLSLLVLLWTASELRTFKRDPRQGTNKSRTLQRGLIKL